MANFGKQKHNLLILTTYSEIKSAKVLFEHKNKIGMMKN